MLYFCLAAAAFSLSQFQIFWEARKLKTIVYKATSLKVLLRLQIKPLPGNSSRTESMTMQDVSERENMQQNNMPEIQKSEFLYVSIVIHKQLNYLCHVLSPPKQVSNVIKNDQLNGIMKIQWLRQTACLVLFEIVSPFHT